MPKCLARVGGMTLVERQIGALRAGGIDGHRRWSSAARRASPAQLGQRRRSSSRTTRFAQTNSLYSLWLARPLLQDGFVVMNCDVLFHPQLLDDLLTARHEDALLIAYQRRRRADTATRR